MRGSGKVDKYFMRGFVRGRTGPSLLYITAKVNLARLHVAETLFEGVSGNAIQ
jgi:hypothetical protein